MMLKSLKIDDVCENFLLLTLQGRITESSYLKTIIISPLADSELSSQRTLLIAEANVETLKEVIRNKKGEQFHRGSVAEKESEGNVRLRWLRADITCLICRRQVCAYYVKRQTVSRVRPLCVNSTA